MNKTIGVNMTHLRSASRWPLLVSWREEWRKRCHDGKARCLSCSMKKSHRGSKGAVSSVPQKWSSETPGFVSASARLSAEVTLSMNGRDCCAADAPQKHARNSDEAKQLEKPPRRLNCATALSS